MRTVALLIGVLIAGCATSSDFVPYGNGNYVINAEDVWGTTTAGGLKVRAAQEANAFCDKQGKKMEVVQAEGRGNIWTGASSNLIFACK